MDDNEWLLAIDFGTSFTVAASRSGQRPPEVLEIDGERRTPSVILIADDGRVVVGRPAEELAAARPTRAVRAVKLRLGDPTPVVVAGRSYPATSLAAELLAKVYDDAVRHHDRAPTEVRLTHPAAWGTGRREQLVRAAELAGLPEPHLVSEPVAAAIAYSDAAALAPGSHVLVYDLGGGTLDLAVLRTTSTGFELVARPGGDPQLGGELFDELLSELIGASLGDALWEELQAGQDEPARQAAAALRREARRAKELLSTQPAAEILLPLPAGLRSMRIGRAEYEALVEPYLAESAQLASRLVLRAGLEPSELTAIYLAGGAARAPIVQAAVASVFPDVPISRRGDPKSAVALGATHRHAVLRLDSLVADHLDAPTTVDREAATIMGAGSPAEESSADGAPEPVDDSRADDREALGHLVVVAGPAAGQRFVLTGDTLVIGRDPGATVTIDDVALSRRHALVSVIGRTIWVEDAGSRNGTSLDGELLREPTVWAAGATLEAGATLLRYEPAGGAARPSVDAVLTLPAERAGDTEAMVLAVPASGRRGIVDPGEEAAFRARVGTLAADLAKAARAESSVRDRWAPGVADVLRMAESGEVGWRRRGSPGFLTVRVGWGEQSAAVHAVLTTGGAPTLRAWAMDVLEVAGRMRSAPVTLDLSASRVVSLRGDRALVLGAARWMVAQVAVLHDPDDVVIEAFGGDDPGDWAWLTTLAHYRSPGAGRPDGATRLVVADGPAAAQARRDASAGPMVLLALGGDDADGPDTTTLTYESLPARVTLSVDGRVTIDRAMADLLTPDLARTIAAQLP